MQQLEQNLIKAAEKYQAVAFDVFDTLLFRDTAAPSDLFVMMEQTGRVPAGFAEKRQAAEAAARTPGREVTLEQIYAQPALQGISPQAEVNAEKEVVVPNRVLLNVARSLHEEGKAVYAISDMYLSEGQVGAMLCRCGFDFLDGVFVSSSYGVQKRSGKLFKLFLQNTGFTASQVLFVGNDRRVDVVGAGMAGIRGYLIPEPARLAYYPAAQNARQGALQAFIRNRQSDEDCWEAIGFSLIGPLLTSFAVWLHDTYGNSGNRLMFLARDMYLVRQIYRELYGEETEYLRVSRRSLCPALLQRPMNEEGLSILADALPRQVLTIRQVLDFCGFDETAALKIADTQQMLDLRTRPLSASVREQLLGLAALSKTTAGLSVRRQADLIRRYLGQNRLREQPPVLVDVGSGGTTQRILESLGGSVMQGACLACDERLHQELPKARAQAFLFGGDPAPLWYWVGQPLLERLISEPVGATVGYDLQDGVVVPVLEPVLPAEHIQRLQKAALEFARTWRTGMWWGMPMPVEMLTQAYLNLVRSPHMDDVENLGALTVEDGETWALAAPRKWAYYCKSPKSFAKDLKQARWKNAFLKKAFRLPLPYARLYETLKTKHGR